MKKLGIVISVVFLLAAVPVSIAVAGNSSKASADSTTGEKVKPSRTQINLTEDQKKEIYDIESKISDLRKQMIDKYAGFGAITKEQADKIKSGMDKREQFMKEKGITPGMFHGFDKGGPGKKGEGRFKGERGRISGEKQAPAAAQSPAPTQ